MRILLIAIFVFWSALVLLGQTFNNRYNFVPYTAGNGYSVEQKGDSLIIFSHYSDSLYKIGIHILNLNGEVLDSKVLFRDSTWFFVGYSNSSDKYHDGFISAGITRFPDPHRRGYMIKWDNQLDTVLTKSFESSTGDSSLFLYQAKALDDGFVAVGSKTNNNGIEKILLIRADSNLNEIWRKEYGNSTIPQAGYSVIQTLDGGYLIGGVRKIPDSWDHVVIKTNALGIQEDVAYFGSGYEGYIAHVALTSDSHYVFGGMKKTGDYEYQSMVCKLDGSLNEVWCNTYNSPGPECYVNSVKALADGSIIICGVDRSNWDMFGYVAKIDPIGNTIWYRKYSQTENNWCFFYDVIQTNDGGFFLTGSLYPEVGLTQDIWGIKLDDMGCLIPGCDTVQHVFSTDAGVGFSIFPNPTTQFINVYVSSPNPLDHIVFELSDLQGRIVKTFSPTLFDTTYMIDVQDLPTGMYVLKMLRDGVMVRSEKILKE